MVKPNSFSIVTPSFNQLPWLELCIASVAMQNTTALVEHIVCDAGSEGIGAFVEKMQAQFPDRKNYRLRFEVGADRGMYDAINKGLRLATGEICSYLNCDEQYLESALQMVGNFFETHTETDILFGDAIVTDGKGKAACYWRPYVPTLRHLSSASLNTLSCSTFFRRGIVDEGLYFDPHWKAVSDLLWIRRLLESGKKAECLHLPLAVFAYLGGNLGASEVAEDEFFKTRKSYSAAYLAWRRALHGARKLFSGAYIRRNLCYEIFTLSHPLERCSFEVKQLGWGWPGNVKSP